MRVALEPLWLYLDWEIIVKFWSCRIFIKSFGVKSFEKQWRGTLWGLEMQVGMLGITKFWKVKKDDKYVKYTLINHGGVVEQMDVVWLVCYLGNYFAHVWPSRDIYIQFLRREIAWQMKNWILFPWSSNIWVRLCQLKLTCLGEDLEKGKVLLIALFDLADEILLMAKGDCKPESAERGNLNQMRLTTRLLIWCSFC